MSHLHFKRSARPIKQRWISEK